MACNENILLSPNLSTQQDSLVFASGVHFRHCTRSVLGRHIHELLALIRLELRNSSVIRNLRRGDSWKPSKFQLPSSCA